MPREVIIDTGPLVAALDRKERAHHACCDVFRQMAKSSRVMVTTEAVLTEATHLLEHLPGGSFHCIDFILASRIALIPTTMEGLKNVSTLLKKYSDLEMDYADATLVALAEELETPQVLTLDRRGFTAYRLHGRTPFHILPD